MTARMQQFEYLIAAEVPLLVDEFDLDTDTREAIDAYIVGLQDWMAGILDWHMLSGRYRETALRRRYRKPPQRIGGPTGRGTSAAVLRLLDNVRTSA
jgi:germacradienol/geosmin synthase